jgi:hypothetical protein
MDLYLDPRNLIMKWSKITNQTCQARLAYPGQHLASIITGVKGRGTAARGDDLADGTEVKTCSRADQLSECNSCKSKVLVWQNECPTCKSTDINIKTDSHWIFSINSKEELDLLLNKVPRIIFILFDRKSINTNTIRLRAWEADTKNEYLRSFFEDYYYNNYSKKLKNNGKPAPCNLHPLKYDFYLMSPKLIFESEIDIDDRNIKINYWNVANSDPEKIPTSILNKKELKELFGPEISKLSKDELKETLPFVPEEKKNELKMRKKIIKTNKQKYRRR